MSRANHPDSEEQIRQIVREELDRATSSAKQPNGYSRREILEGVAMLGTGAAVGGLSTYGAVGRAVAEEGSGTIGTQDSPVDAIYVNDLYQNTDHISTGSIVLEDTTSE
ncbi:hypothetical protein [Natranaeroarchaeum sulfidigenes]|uniref:Uncharacterized protein n=1 Tax=Natranaeroarchaeum sulfidigenes TaxID=2784880 RepID=A0A897MPP0_9EURY|nr:hypothetical protein [Natranaeroarchaeum sulfidigenes]QSG02527.1 hypothetical protein AArcS_1310 [Natranaeroarchaeum sulfidigenes]